MNLLGKASFSLAFLLLLPHAVSSQTSRIQGQVMDPNRRPVAEVHVELLNDVESVVRRSRTDGSGSYYFSGLSAGRYLIRVRPFGTNFEEQTQEVEINTFIGGRQVADMQQKDFYLKIRKDQRAAIAPPGVVFAQDVPEDAKRAYERAVSEIAAKNADAGARELENALAIFPEYFQALDLMGVELLKRQKYDESIKFFERAVVVNEKSSNSWYGLSFCYYALDQAAKAVEAARKAGTFNPDSADIALMLGVALRKDKQYTEAEKSLLRAKKLSDGRSADVLWNLALLYAHNLKNYRLAAVELESYLKVNPDHPNAALLKKLIQQYRSQS